MGTFGTPCPEDQVAVTAIVREDGEALFTAPRKLEITQWSGTFGLAFAAAGATGPAESPPSAFNADRWFVPPGLAAVQDLHQAAFPDAPPSGALAADVHSP